jgi:hypothetical protein
MPGRALRYDSPAEALLTPRRNEPPYLADKPPGEAGWRAESEGLMKARAC